MCDDQNLTSNRAATSGGSSRQKPNRNAHFRCVFHPESPRGPARLVFHFPGRRHAFSTVDVSLDMVAELTDGMTGSPLRRLRRLGHLIWAICRAERRALYAEKLRERLTV